MKDSVSSVYAPIQFINVSPMSGSAAGKTYADQRSSQNIFHRDSQLSLKRLIHFMPLLVTKMQAIG
jgi:hypothetical protein